MAVKSGIIYLANGEKLHNVNDDAALTVQTLLPLPLGGMGPEYVCLSICRHLAGDGLRVCMTVPRKSRGYTDLFVEAALPPLARLLPFKWIRQYALHRVERVFRSKVQTGDVAYLWSNVSLETTRMLNERGIKVVREKTNCHKATAKRIYDEAYERIGLLPSHGISDEWIRKELEELQLADGVFSASAMVTQSLADNGVPTAKIIDSSYGWEPSRLGGTERSLPPCDGLTVIFVGWVSVIKGAHLLLQAWSQAQIKGRLILAGSVEPVFAEKFSHLLNRKDVLQMGFVKDMGPLYRSADVFAFPSLAEGGPLVTYEAMANGLPTIASPMGAGRVLRNSLEGIVVDPYDIDGWILGLRSLAKSIELRRHYSDAARPRAEQFTWDRVGIDRRRSLLDRFSPAPLFKLKSHDASNGHMAVY